MIVHGKPVQTIWPHPDQLGAVQLIDQRALPHRMIVESIDSLEQMARAIEEMHVRGAPLIGVSAAWGMAIAAYEISSENPDWRIVLDEALIRLGRTRPTAVNLFWALERQRKVLQICGSLEQAKVALWKSAIFIQNEDIETCRRIGMQGLPLIQKIFEAKKHTLGISNPVVNILTHCNAGWLACVDHGTATSPMYAAHDSGIPVHVWVDETRPRNQGAKLTAWELGQHGIPHTLIPDNAGGHLMQHGMVDLVIVGADRVTSHGDAANKIGTYLKALAAKDNGIPFYVALPSSTIDWSMSDGVVEIPIETRGEDEVRKMDGLLPDGTIGEVLVCPESTPAVNFGFDVTPHRLITGLILEHGVFGADANILSLARATWSQNGLG